MKAKLSLEAHKDVLCSYQLGLESDFTPESVIAAYSEAHRLANRFDVWGLKKIQPDQMSEIPRAQHNNEPNGVADMLTCAALRLQELYRSTEMFTRYIDDYFEDLALQIRDDGYALEFADRGLMSGRYESGLFIPDDLSGLVDAVTKVSGKLELEKPLSREL